MTQPHDIAPKGRENRGDYIKYKALLLTVGPLFGKQKKNVAVGYEEGTQTYRTPPTRGCGARRRSRGRARSTFGALMKSLRNGTISVPIVGGTGKFTGAHGVLIIGPGDLSSLNTYRLSLPGVGRRRLSEPARASRA